MKFGICTPLDTAPAVKAAGWDYVEESVQGFLQGELDDGQWRGAEIARAAPLPILSANLLVPAGMKITGTEANLERLSRYIERVTQRAAMVGMRVLVFGSGGARNVPEGFDRERATRQIVEFGRMCGPAAEKNGITIVVEPLNRGECNIINSVAEAAQIARAVDHANFQCLVDTYHLWLEDEPVENVREAMQWIRHVHVADKVGRVPPGESGQSDYRPLLRELKRAGYDGLISVEAGFSESEIREKGSKVLGFLKNQWQEA